MKAEAPIDEWVRPARGHPGRHYSVAISAEHEAVIKFVSTLEHLSDDAREIKERFPDIPEKRLEYFGETMHDDGVLIPLGEGKGFKVDQEQCLAIGSKPVNKYWPTRLVVDEKGVRVIRDREGPIIEAEAAKKEFVKISAWHKAKVDEVKATAERQARRRPHGEASRHRWTVLRLRRRRPKRRSSRTSISICRSSRTSPRPRRRAPPKKDDAPERRNDRAQMVRRYPAARLGDTDMVQPCGSKGKPTLNRTSKTGFLPMPSKRESSTCQWREARQQRP